ncbi:uncharacterized protein [Gossypium hirsutum]|uniref:Uncharacterized protein isoform X1 n=2 Tax=Gossypium hirsutum TaxID=3635 RepID=A0ABM3AGZ3_GOSHI|nr:uncharacterized protein LOC107912611 isoform X1 [Gossypium hirsutum]XP_040954098.1 uncharacterized protein LOC107912611 isoform X1 [Gossypium hirsutum]
MGFIVQLGQCRLDQLLIRSMSLISSIRKIYYPVIPLLFSLMWIFLVKKYLHFVVYSCLQDRSKWFGELPWEESLQDAHEFGKLVLFSNLDPAYSSAEVEDIVWNAFNELAEQR